MANDKSKLVDLFIPPREGNDDPNMIISVNGKNYILPKGKVSKVPPCVKYEYERSLRAKGTQRETVDRLIDEATQIKSVQQSNKSENAE